jgi:hypothetical protein
MVLVLRAVTLRRVAAAGLTMHLPTVRERADIGKLSGQIVGTRTDRKLPLYYLLEEFELLAWRD